MSYSSLNFLFQRNFDEYVEVEALTFKPEFSVRYLTPLTCLQVLKLKFWHKQGTHVPLKIIQYFATQQYREYKFGIKHTAKCTRSECFLASTSGKFPTNYTRLAEDLIPAAAFVAKALTGSGFRAYLFILEQASGGKECAQLEERQQGIYLVGVRSSHRRNSPRRQNKCETCKQVPRKCVGLEAAGGTIYLRPTVKSLRHSRKVKKAAREYNMVQRP